MNLFISLFLLLLSSTLWAHPAGQKGREGSFMVSAKSLTYLGVEFKGITGAGPWTLPAQSLVRIKFTDGVYRRFDGEITFVIVKVLQRLGDTVVVSSRDLEDGDEVAISGAKFLRMTENDLNSETVDTCSH